MAEELAFLENRADREREFCRLRVRKESTLKALVTGFLREPCGYSVLADAVRDRRCDRPLRNVKGK